MGRTARARPMPSHVSTSGFFRKLGAISGDLSAAVTSLLFPAPCRLCDQLLVHAKRLPVCDACVSSFTQISSECCSTCGQPWTTQEGTLSPESICRECYADKFSFKFARSFGVYEGNLSRAILLLKHDPIPPLSDWFARQLKRKFEEELGKLQIDIVVPVPLHRQRRKGRGFNQVDLFGRPLARLLGLPYRPNLLVRAKPRPEKHLLNMEERWESVRGAFAMRKASPVDNLKILLLDDVMTSGATLDACSRVLRDAGASFVACLTVGRALRFASPAREELEVTGVKEAR